MLEHILTPQDWLRLAMRSEYYRVYKQSLIWALSCALYMYILYTYSIVCASCHYAENPWYWWDTSSSRFYCQIVTRFSSAGRILYSLKSLEGHENAYCIYIAWGENLHKFYDLIYSHPRKFSPWNFGYVTPICMISLTVHEVFSAKINAPFLLTCESFLPWKFPAIRYTVHVANLQVNLREGCKKILVKDR